MSRKLTPLAATSTTTSPSPGSGAGRSVYSSTSGPPWAASTIARIPLVNYAPPATRRRGPAVGGPRVSVRESRRTPAEVMSGGHPGEGAGFQGHPDGAVGAGGEAVRLLAGQVELPDRAAGGDAAEPGGRPRGVPERPVRAGGGRVRAAGAGGSGPRGTRAPRRGR